MNIQNYTLKEKEAPPESTWHKRLPGTFIQKSAVTLAIWLQALQHPNHSRVQPAACLYPF